MVLYYDTKFGHSILSNTSANVNVNTNTHTGTAKASESDIYKYYKDLEKRIEYLENRREFILDKSDVNTERLLLKIKNYLFYILILLVFIALKIINY
jgi:hypothetical protein